MSRERTSAGPASEKPLQRYPSTSRRRIWRSSLRNSVREASPRISKLTSAEGLRLGGPCYGVGERLGSDGMADPVSQFAPRMAYGARQVPRVAWYIGHGMVMRRLRQAVRERAGEQPQTRVNVPDRRRLYAD